MSPLSRESSIALHLLVLKADWHSRAAMWRLTLPASSAFGTVWRKAGSAGRGTLVDGYRA